MQYEPIKKSLGKLISGPPFFRKAFYFAIDLLLLRTWHVRRTLKKVAATLPENAVILDAGSGLGQYTWRMCRMNRTWRISGVDIDDGQTKDCSEFFRKTGFESRASFITADLASFIQTGSFNLILSVDVMEHIKEDEKVFANFYESLKPGGRLIISTPSDRGGSDAHGAGDESFIDEHVRNGYSVSEITKKLTTAGFDSVEARYTYGKPGALSWVLTMKYPVRMLNISYIFFIILPLYYLIFLPVSVVLNMMDIRMNHRSGTGLIVTARKI